jgi:Restriction endonuclease NotI
VKAGSPSSSSRKSAKRSKSQYRFGIGEWYGKSFVHLKPEERRYLASIQQLPEKKKPPIICPFLSRPGRAVNCWKPGGICSLRSYERHGETQYVALDPHGSSIRTTCPSRFEQNSSIYRWIGEILLNNPNAVAVGETPFLQRAPRAAGDPESNRKVGRIDNVLVSVSSNPLDWCPVEKQAVYFSGKKMALDFRRMARSTAQELPFPLATRRPDYRSSGPKRLMPQLQVKVPTLRTWGKKMAVVVDQDFFDKLGNIAEANDLSNAEVVWFIVSYKEEGPQITLDRHRVVITTLDESVRGLVAAVPLPRMQFESAIKARLERLVSKPTQIPSDQ